MATYASTEFPSDISEVNEIGFSTEESKVISVPRLKETKIQMECRLFEILELKNKDGIPVRLLIGEIVCFHIDQSLYHQGRIDTQKLAP